MRYVKLKARRLGVDPNRLGVWGGSAGGHRSLMFGRASDAGDPSAADAVLRAGNRVAAVVAYHPPVDLRRISGSGAVFVAGGTTLLTCTLP